MAAKTSVTLDALLDEFPELDAGALARFTPDELAELGASLRARPPGLELDEAGIAEVRRRVAEVDAGTAVTMSIEESVRRIRAELDL